ncbi:MAG: histidine kinase [Clostridia bacterium]|nr:histidine kinase [Clostridia bacterium]
MTFKDLSIKRKIIYLYLPLAIIPMILFAGISMKFYESAIIKRSLSSMSDNNVLISDRIDGIISEAEGSATLLTISINRLLNSDAFHGMLSNDIKLYNLISNELAYAKLIYKTIDSIGFIDIDGRLYYSDYELQNGRNAITDSKMYEILMATTGNSVWFELSNRDYLTKDPDQKMLTLGKKVWNINTGATIGYLFVNIDEQVFTDLIKGQLADYIVYNVGHQQLISTAEDGVSNVKVAPFLSSAATSDILSTGGERTLISKVHIDKLGWTLLSKADLNLFTQDLANIILLIIIMLITIILLEITMTLALNRLITNPIMKLKNGVEEISKGNFDFRFKMKTNDEIGLFAMSFNHMSAQIKKLLFDVEREEKKKREYELALIQQQIKPHFLYNTLDIILKLSQLGQERKAQKVTRRLADYYRNSLSGGADVISVKNELKITLDYLELQKLRYSDVFDYRIEVSELMESIMIPKLSLQPIVENAIEHGFKYLSETGLIRIYDEMHEDAYEIIVEDNGVGMSEELMNKLNQVLSDPSDHQTIKSFGIKNVSHRMKLFFGHEYGVYIVSKAGVGTEIRIKLPKDGQYD